MRRSIVALVVGMLMLAAAVPALAQNNDEAYPPVPEPTCALVVEVVTLPGIISLQGSNWQPNSTVTIDILGLIYEAETDEDGNFREDLLINEEDLLNILPDDIDLDGTFELNIECRGFDQEGEPHTVMLTIQVQLTLLNGEPGDPTCFLTLEVLELQPLLRWTGSGWQPESTVLISPLLVTWETETDEEGNIDDDIVIAEEELIDLFDDLTGGVLVCEGFDEDGEPVSVPLGVEIEPTLLDELGLGGLLNGDPLNGNGGNGITSLTDVVGSLLGTGGDDALISLPISAQGQPLDWDPRTNGASFVALLAMFLIAIGGVDFLVWSRRNNDKTQPDGQTI